MLFATAGQHEVVARLESDTIEADNSRYAVLGIDATVPVLIVDSDPKGEDAFFLSAALSPGGKVSSGLKPVVESPRALRRDSLDKYAAVILANIERLDPAEVEALEAYARSGGGVGFFLGERCHSDFYNRELYRDGQGLFPLPLGTATELLVDRLDKAPDLEITDHPIFSVFAGERNSFISSVIIERYFTAAKGWAPPPDSTVKVIAQLRNHAPLAVERRFGAGRVVAFLTKASPAVDGRRHVGTTGAATIPAMSWRLLELRSLSGRRTPARRVATGRHSATSRTSTPRNFSRRCVSCCRSAAAAGRPSIRYRSTQQPRKPN